VPVVDPLLVPPVEPDVPELVVLPVDEVPTEPPLDVVPPIDVLPAEVEDPVVPWDVPVVLDESGGAVVAPHAASKRANNNSNTSFCFDVIAGNPPCLEVRSMGSKDELLTRQAELIEP
jgi:hypothetical protein